jgi:hypothetical protein
VTYFLVNRADAAVASLGQAAVETEKLISFYAAEHGPEDPIVAHFTAIRHVADDLAEQIRTDPADAAQTIRNWERENVTAFAVGGTVVHTT